MVLFCAAAILTVEVITGKGHWCKSGKGLVPVLWVFVRDLTGTHCDECFFTTDTSLGAKEVIELYGGRWNIETTFQEIMSQSNHGSAKKESPFLI